MAISIYRADYLLYIFNNRINLPKFDMIYLLRNKLPHLANY